MPLQLDQMNEGYFQLSNSKLIGLYLPPSEKIWVRQLGWWHSQVTWKNKSHVLVTTNQMIYSLKFHYQLSIHYIYIYIHYIFTIHPLYIYIYILYIDIIHTYTYTYIYPLIIHLYPLYMHYQTTVFPTSAQCSSGPSGHARSLAPPPPPAAAWWRSVASRKRRRRRWAPACGRPPPWGKVVGKAGKPKFNIVFMKK